MSCSTRLSTKANHYNRELDGCVADANFLILGWVVGFEPTATGTTIQRSTS
jgi:hypothetical protein